MIFSGDLVTLYLREDNQWLLIGGMRNLKLEINAELIEAPSKETGPWRHYLNNAGERYVDITGSGVFTDNKSENLIQELALSGAKAEYRLNFAHDKAIAGEFMIRNYQHFADMDSEENYVLSLVSSGKITRDNIISAG